MKTNRWLGLALMVGTLLACGDATAPSEPVEKMDVSVAGNCDQPTLMSQPVVGLSAMCDPGSGGGFPEPADGVNVTQWEFWRDAIDAIAAKGGSCATIANHLRYDVTLRQEGDLQWGGYIAYTNGKYGDGIGGDWIAVREALWNAEFGPYATASPEQVLVHEWAHWYYGLTGSNQDESMADFYEHVIYAHCW